MDSGYSYEINLAACGTGVPKCVKDLVGKNTAAYVGTATSRHPGRTQFSMQFSGKDGDNYNFSYFRAVDGMGVLQSESGVLQNFNYDKETDSFHGDVVFTSIGWKGSLRGKNWNGIIEMNDGHTYDLALLPVSKQKLSAPPLRKGAAYTASVSSRGGSNKAFVMHFGNKAGDTGSTFHFSASGFGHAGHTAEQFRGRLENFRIQDGRGGSKLFDADVVFDDQSWTGKLKGSDWKGTIKMRNGYTYDIDVAPNGKHPTKYPESAAYFGHAVAKRYTYVDVASFAVSSKKGSSYVFSATGFKLDKFAEAHMGEFQNFTFDKDSERFTADVMFYNHPWVGKMWGKQWKGHIRMDSGHKYAVDFDPFASRK
eukprot:TRINITY_DN28781_c0_g1_i1.p1 TRINITY_DN28781_c0_g1~~TRINITY_DN28781_c0_g1_i1.p1  ORF type:complete len:367 (-),score=64.68 TRINITY_DN28781_c0_g1_i1:281-1381(-)